MNDEFVKWIGVIGSIASLVGLPVAIWQIYKTRRATEAATKAVLRTQNIISRNLILSDTSTCTRNLEEIKFYVRIERYESALIRISDLISSLIRIQQRSENAENLIFIEFEEMLSQLSIIREDFEKKVVKSSVRINMVQINSELSKISDNLNKLIGSTIIVIEKGEENG